MASLARRARATLLMWLLVVAGFALVYGARSAGQPKVETAGYAALIATIVLSAAVAAWCFAIDGAREDRARDLRKKRRHTEPWLWWREDWADGFAYDEASLATGRDWLFGVLSLSVTTVLLIAAGPAWKAQEGAAQRPFVVALAAAGVVVSARLAVRAAARTRQVMRGPAVCRFERVPTLPGDLFEGRIEWPCATRTEGVALVLRCHYVFLQSTSSSEHIGSRRYRRGSPGRPASRYDPALFFEETGAVAARVGSALHISVSLRIPRLEPVRQATFNPGGTLEWSLEARADGMAPVRFTLPVFPSDVEAVSPRG